jgi:hypothetical protein
MKYFKVEYFSRLKRTTQKVIVESIDEEMAKRAVESYYYGEVISVKEMGE